jgi:class 3 adenylate cyclase/tetratricopeptide (TPR) repeat protein
MNGHSERRLVTCLFIDVVGSTDATVQLGPERMQRLLGEAFAAMSSTIAAEGGTVEKYVGDAIFALFGAPVTHADDAARALRAAESCARWSSAEASGARLAVRVGIETGEALVDLAAVDQRERMAVGRCVNVAARLQQQAAPGEIVVGPTTYEATSKSAAFEAVGAVDLKGLGQVEAWRFTGFRGTDTSTETGFVGRQAELDRLGAAFERVAGGTSTLALVVGPPGQGKSRLVGEAITRFPTFRALQARCRPAAETGVSTPLRQLLDGEVGNATAESVSDRVSGLLGPAEGGTAAAAINHGAGLAADDEILRLPRMEQRGTIAEAWRRYLRAVAGERQIVVWIEDVHWADPVLLKVMDHATWDLDAPLLVIATARPEFAGTAHLRPRDDRPHVDLPPLDAESARRLAQSAGHHDIDPARAAGNPLFIIELARARSAGGEMPVTLQAAISARLDELSADERDLLQRTSVAGETFDARDAAILGDREPAEVAGALGRIAHLGFVIPVDSRYRFHHELIREVAYSRLPVAERLALHARYAEEGVDAEDVEALAHHWWQALLPPDAEWVWDDPTRLARMRRAAFDAQVSAGRRLEERNAYEEAAEVYARAIEFAEEPVDRAVAETCLARAFVRQGLGDDAWAHRLRAIDAYGDAGETPPADLYADMLEVATQNWGYFQNLPDPDQVRRLLEEGERAARDSGDEVALARLLVERATFSGDPTVADEIVPLLLSEDAVPHADAAHRLAQVYLWDGEVDRSRDLYAAIFDRLLPAGAVINEPEALLWAAVAAVHAGALDDADAFADRLIEIAPRRSVHTQHHGFPIKALVHLVRGEWDGVTEQGEALARLVDAHPDASFCLVGGAGCAYAAMADLLAGRPPERLDELVARTLAESPLVQASTLMVPRVMEGDPTALDEGLKAYGPDLEVWDRARSWDVCDLMPALAMTMLERWDELGPTLERLDRFAEGGSRLAGATAAAIREEIAAADGGPPPVHEALRAQGYLGVSELLRFRPG